MVCCCPANGELMAGIVIWASTPGTICGMAFMTGTVGTAPILRGLGSGTGALGIGIDAGVTAGGWVGVKCAGICVDA